MFVSSTCYDLSQIRADIREFLLSLGVEPLLSEHTTFPVNPQADTLENCVNVVRQRADIFVLIVGARYGTQAEGKSITNLEYLEARAKGIPIYVFLLKSIQHALPIWKNNRAGDYANVVDTPKLFEFAESLRDTKQHWVFPFEMAKEIIEILRQQIAFLFMDALFAREKLNNLPLTPLLSGLSGESLRLVVERPPCWEYKLFAVTLISEIERLKPRKWDVGYGLKIGRTNLLEDPIQAMDWVSTKTAALGALTHTANVLMNKAANEAFGPPGVAGDADLIVYTVRRLADVYSSALDWAIECNSLDADSEFARLFEIFGRAANEIFAWIENMGPKILESIESALERVNRGETVQLNLMFTIGTPDFGDFYTELERLKRRFGVS